MDNVIKIILFGKEFKYIALIVFINTSNYL